MEELHLPLDKLKRWIHSLYLFLHSHREITSAHSVDFFTCNYWDSHIQPGWREELLSASEEQLVEPNAGGSPGMWISSMVEFSRCRSCHLIPPRFLYLFLYKR